VIVDKKGKTRTCIHVPTEELTISEVQTDLLKGVHLLYLDSRHTDTAYHVAKSATTLNIPILIDCEKDRGGSFSQLLKLAQYLCTNASFPINYTGKKDLLEAMSSLLEGNTKWIITTLGSNGSLLMERCNEIFPESVKKVNQYSDLIPAVERNTVTFMIYSSEHGNFNLYHCSSCYVEEIVDTTGAGDIFIGSICFSLLKNYPKTKMLRLSSYMASKKISNEAYNGIPFLNEIDEQYLL